MMRPSQVHLLDPAVVPDRVARTLPTKQGDLPPARSPHRKAHVFLDSEIAKEVRDLVRAADSERGAAMNAQPGDVLAEELDPSARAGQLAGDGVEQRRLPRA